MPFKFAGRYESWAVIDDAVVIPIGRDGKKQYTLAIGFSVIPGGAGHEYYFYVGERELGSGDLRRFFKGSDTKFIQGDDRARVLHLLDLGTERIITVFQPRSVLRYIDHPLPQKAMIKHNLVTSTFVRCGYTVTVEDPILGKRSLWHDLRQGEPVK